uniref:Uncharacterized protein n=1 Tax=Rhizophora mucronata TaxID=61149 RepID=A0A2P2Q877_RHIMU
MVSIHWRYNQNLWPKVCVALRLNHAMLISSTSTIKTIKIQKQLKNSQIFS